MPFLPARRFKKRFPEALELGTPPAEKPAAGQPVPVPWLLAEGLTPEQACTDNENWCGVMQVSWGGSGMGKGE